MKNNKRVTRMEKKIKRTRKKMKFRLKCQTKKKLCSSNSFDSKVASLKGIVGVCTKDIREFHILAPKELR